MRPPGLRWQWSTSSSPGSCHRRRLLAGNPIGFEKLDVSVQPIAISHTWYCVAWIFARRAHGWEVGAGPTPLQVRIGTKGGSEAVVRALTAALAEGLATFTLDVKNA